MQAAARDVPAAEESDASAHFFIMGGWQSQWPLPSHSTTAHSARRWQGPGERVRVEPHGEVLEAPLLQDGSRSPCLGPQVVILRHALEHMADICLFVQIVDALVPQTGNQLLEVFGLLDTKMSVEQFFAVPKISLDRIPQRSVDLDPQMVEHLVEVPTVLTLSFLQQQRAEQIVDIPVPRGRGRRRQGFLPEPDCTASVAGQTIDIPVPRRGGSGSGGPQGFDPRQDSTASVAVQNVDIPVPRRGGSGSGGPQGSSPKIRIQQQSVRSA